MRFNVAGLRSRKAASISQPDNDLPADEKNGGAITDLSDTDSSRLSLELQEEKELQRNPNHVNAKADLGVQKAEAAALVWSKTAVRLTLGWVWLCFFMLAFQQAVLLNATANAYSSFSSLPAYTTASILANIIGGVLKLPIAKMLNLWGRAEGFFVFFGVYLLGMIILASCNNAQTYAAGYVFYWIGYDALYLIMDVFVADVTGLRNRAWAFAFVSTPFICTAFTGPLAAQSFLKMTTWHWAIGAFCIIQVFVFIPLGVVFKLYQRKAQKLGLFVREPSGRTTAQSIVHYLHEFDVVGCIILMAAFILFLLPFSLVTYGRATYGGATFIAMVVIGIILFPVFAIWERFFARTHFVRWELLRQRTILGGCMLAMTVYFSFYCWDLYYYYFVYVVYNLNVSETGYMTEIYNVGSCFWGVVFGVYIRWSHHFKYAALFFGLPMLMLGAGLTIYFRSNAHGIGYVVMSQIFIAFGGGTLVIAEDMAVMAASDRSGVAMALSIIGLSSSIGGAIGDAVSGAIFGGTWLKAYESAAPADAQSLAETLYLGGYLSQTEYAPGTAVREAINYAWGRVQFYEGIAATCVLVLGIPAIAMWKNYNVKERQQNKGTLV